ncbi:MAG: PAS domain S-box protein [Bacteroidia bacterium]
MKFDFKDIFDEFPSIVYVKNQEGVYQYANFAFETFMGKSLNECIGKTDFDLFDEKMAKTHREHDNELFENGMALDSSPRFYRRYDGTTCWLQTSKKIIELENGEKGVFGITNDVSEQKAKERALKRANYLEATIHRITSSLFDLENEEEIVWKFIKDTFNELGLKDIVLYLKSESEDSLYQAAVENVNKVEGKKIITPKKYAFSEGVVGRAARTRKTQLVKNTLVDEDYIVDDANRKSELAVPIIVEGELIGVLDSEHEKEGFYTKFHIDVFETASKLLGLKIVQLRDYKLYEETQNYLNQILESPENLVVFSLDNEYRYKAFNSKHRAIMKNIWGAEIANGLSMLDFISSDEDRAKAKTNFDRVLLGEEFTLVEAYGDEQLSRQYWENFYSPQRSEKGEIIGLTVFVRDVSKELQFQNELKNSQSLLESINSNIRDGLCRKSLKEGFIYTNQGMSKLFGYSAQEFSQLPIPMVLAEPEFAGQIVEDLKKGKSYRNVEVLWRRKDGSTFWGLLNCNGFIQDNDFLIDSSIVDISEIKRAKEDLQTNVKKLEKLNSELDHLVYRTSHDLRTPVASLLGLLEMLRLDDFPDPRKYHDIFASQLNRLDHIIKDIINYRKIAKVGEQIEQIDLELVIYEILKDNEFTEGSDTVNKIVEIGDQCSLGVKLDKFSLNILLNNLISNAIKYSDNKKEDSFVKITTNCTNDMARITVQDNGIGITKDQQPLVFDMFHRATNKKSGSGLGLFILKEAVNKMGGKVEFTSTEGVGTTFVVELPQKP